MSLITSFLEAVIVCLCYYLLKDKKFNLRNILWLIYLVVFFAAAYLFISKVIYRSHHPAVWDFTSIYLFGKVAATGHNFYSPEDYRIVFNSLHLPFTDYQRLVEEVVEVGCPYPPPTILYFAPLGHLPYNSALLVWTIINFIVALACIYLIYDQFFKSDKLNGLLLVASLFFFFIQAKSTVLYSQTNFILLLYLLLMKKYSDRGAAGVFLALAMFTKPYVIIIGLFFLLTKNWKAVIYFVLSSAILCGITLALFGKEQFYSYVFDNPSQRMPSELFYQDINQSLHSVLLRSGLLTLGKSSLYMYIVMGILVLTGLYLAFLVKRKLYDYIVPVLLLVGLLLYPGTLAYYAVHLFFIFFQFFDEKKQLGFKPYLTVPIIGIVYVLCADPFFAAIIFLIGLLVVKSTGRLDFSGAPPKNMASNTQLKF